MLIPEVGYFLSKTFLDATKTHWQAGFGGSVVASKGAGFLVGSIDRTRQMRIAPNKVPKAIGLRRVLTESRIAVVLFNAVGC
jgi:hypothetical protein